MTYKDFTAKYKQLNPEAKKPEIDAAWKKHKEENPPASGSAAIPETVKTDENGAGEGAGEDLGAGEGAGEDLGGGEGAGEDLGGGEGAGEAQSDSETSIVKRAMEVFKSHTVDVIYFTSDITAFIEPQYARMHAQSLGNDKVIPVKREEV